MENAKIIAKREASSMASTWNEYLCVRNLAKGRAVVEICRYESLGEWLGEDDDGNEIPVPSEFNGVPVAGIEDGYLVGGELQCWDQEDAREYEEVELEEVLHWINGKHFKIDDNITSAVRQALEH